MNTTSKTHGRKRSQSVILLVSEFDTLFNRGMSIKEIAKKYNVDESYVYRLLQEIAEKNGKTREFYITGTSFKKENVIGQDHSSYTHFQTEDIEKINTSYENVISQIKEIQENINNFLETTKGNQMMMEETI